MPRKASPYVRVTTVLDFVDSNWKQYWFKSVGLEEADRISKESTTFGKNVHSIAENHLIGSPLPEELTERQKTCGNYLVQWCKEAVVQPLGLGGKKAVELDLKSEKYKLTGHPDLLCTFGTNPLPWVADWKTSKKCSKGYALQLAAYAYMVKEQYGLEIHDGVIVRVPNDPNAVPQFETHTFHLLLKKYWPMFLKCLEVYHYYNGKGKWAKGA